MVRKCKAPPKLPDPIQDRQRHLVHATAACSHAERKAAIPSRASWKALPRRDPAAHASHLEARSPDSGISHITKQRTTCVYSIPEPLTQEPTRYAPDFRQLMPDAGNGQGAIHELGGGTFLRRLPNVGKEYPDKSSGSCLVVDCGRRRGGEGGKVSSGRESKKKKTKSVDEIDPSPASPLPRSLPP